MSYPNSLARLIEAFRSLPGVGEKTAERYALSVADMDEMSARELAESISDVKTKLTHCHICGNLSESDECEICRDTTRNHKQIFVVQSAKDVIVMERTNEYRGVYHVLNGLISASKGILPADLNIQSLLEKAQDAEEIILATDTTMDGETTAMYLDKLLKEKNPNLLVTRIARGLPSGGLLDYADEMTLAHALAGRRRMGE